MSIYEEKLKAEEPVLPQLPTIKVKDFSEDVLNLESISNMTPYQSEAHEVEGPLVEQRTIVEDT
jgi:hypothetical protein